jgi:hypothetical protein
MKTLIFVASFFCFASSYAQDSVKIKQIDSLVSIILHTRDLYTQRDSTVQDYPGIGLHMKTYLTMMRYGKELKKYSQIVNTTQQQNQIAKQGVTGSAFKETKMTWYFADGKCFFHSLKSGKAEDRAILLSQLADTFLKKIASEN